MEQHREELIKECNKKVAGYKTKWEEFTASAKSKLESIKNSNVEEAELEELDEMSNSVLDVVNNQLKIAKEGEELLRWVKENGLEGSLKPKDLQNLEACIGATSLGSLENINDFPEFEKSLEKIENEPKQNIKSAPSLENL